MRETPHATIVNNSPFLSPPPRVLHELKTASLDEDTVTNLLQRFEGYKADRMESTRARGDVCGRSEIRRIKGGFRVPGGALDSLVTSFANRASNVGYCSVSARIRGETSAIRGTAWPR